MTGYSLRDDWTLGFVAVKICIEDVLCMLCNKRYRSINQSPCSHCGWTLNFKEDKQ